VLGLYARLSTARRDWRGAIDWGEQAIARTLDPATLGVVGDAHAALGDTAKAEEYFRVLEVAVSRQAGPFHRAWSLFLLDHDRRTAEVLDKAQEEIVVRKDVYGWDLLAWALHKNGRDADARGAMGHALALGTRDAMLFYHAGMIERDLGDRGAARRHLADALAVNPYWHPTQPDSARAALEGL
jgi:tetratricopeptide (TPR) repeat protein